MHRLPLIIILVLGVHGCASEEQAARAAYLDALLSLQKDPAQGVRQLRAVAQRHPDSQVAADARQRVHLALDAYAGTISRGLASYRYDTGRFPDETVGLGSLLTNLQKLPDWHGPYLSVDLAALLDFFDYRSDGTGFRLSVR